MNRYKITEAIVMIDSTKMCASRLALLARFLTLLIVEFRADPVFPMRSLIFLFYAR